MNDSLLEFIKNIKFIEEITAGDGFSWMITVIGAVLAFYLIQRMQVKIERHSLLYSIENELKDLFSMDIATIITTKNSDDNELKSFNDINLRTVLGEEWVCDDQIINQIQHNRQRYWEILSKEDAKYYLGSQAFQDCLSWFRRVRKLYKDKIIKSIDLADLWRQILPFGCSGRLAYFEKYFRHAKDIDGVVSIVVETLISCDKHKMDYAVEYLFKEMTHSDKEILRTNTKFSRLANKYKYVLNEKIDNRPCNTCDA